MKNPQLSTAQYNWLIRLIDKDLAYTEECHRQEPNRIFAIRIANMEELKKTLSGMKAHSLARSTQQR